MTPMDDNKAACEREHKTAHLPDTVRDEIYRVAKNVNWTPYDSAVIEFYEDIADVALLAYTAGEERREGQVNAYQEWAHELGQHIIKEHKAGTVDDEAAAILDGYHVGLQPVAGGGQGEPGEHTLAAAVRLLKLAKARGAFNREVPQ